MTIATRRFTALLLCLGAGFAATALHASSAEAAKLKLGVYDCLSYNSFTGLLDYQGSVKLRSGRRYQHSYGRKGTRLTKPNGGRYVIRGQWARFRSGPLKRTPGRISPASGSNRYPHFALYVNGRTSGVACYFDSKP